MLEAMVATVVRAEGSPCTSLRVTVPCVVGCQVMLVGDPADIPVYDVLVNAF